MGALVSCVPALIGCSDGGQGEAKNPATACPPVCAQASGSGGAAGSSSAAAAGASAGAAAAGRPGGGSAVASSGGAGGMHAATAGASAGSEPAPAGANGAAGSAGSAGGGGAAGSAAPGPQTLPPTTDYAQAGPFSTKVESNTGPGSNYTIYRPDPLGENGFVHSPIVFGPGILTTASSYKAVLTHLASHGFVTICVNSLSGGPNAPGNLDAMKTGLDWLIAQNAEAGIYQGKLAVDRAVAMGYSIGATASTQLASHPAIFTTVSIHGHNTSGDPHGPILLLTGTNDVIDDNRKTLATLEEAPAVLMALPIGHLDVLTELAMSSPISPSTRYIAPITAWLRYWVNGDNGAKRSFWGTGCEMCSSPWITPETNARWDAQTL